MESTTYTVNGRDFELQHHGVKGMKWGKRKARPEHTSTGHRDGKATTESPEAQAAAKEARRKKAKIAVAIGAAVVGTALAAYGAKKASDALKDKAFKSAHERGKKAIEKYMDEQFFKKVRPVYNDKNALVKALDDHEFEFRRLSMENNQYASRASKNTVAAVKELLGKNGEMPLAQLKRMGLSVAMPSVADPDYFKGYDFRPKTFKPKRS